ncbi:RNA 3'-terminal phosphate cyclase [Sarocladium strictum]
MEPIELDGRTGEGGGQLVRLAVGLSALTTRPVKITNVRGNRGGGRGGGLKSQHVTGIQFIALVTDADTEGLSVGSHTLTFIPRIPPSGLTQRKFTISGESGAASTLLILQTILPFLLFAAGDPIHLVISGGTNAAMSLSFEYLDQVLLPTLEERFGINVERELKRRGWSLGRQSRGEIAITIHPLQLGEKLHFKPPTPRRFPESFAVKRVDITLITPAFTHRILQAALVDNLSELYPNADFNFEEIEDSGDQARLYILLVAHSPSNIRFTRDILTSFPKKAKTADTFLHQIASRICRELDEEVSRASEVDEFLQDQLICFQTIAEGYSSFLRTEEPLSEADLAEAFADLEALTKGTGSVRIDKGLKPFGHGSLHAQTARWVAAEMLPEARFYKKGTVVKGAGISLQ